MDGSEIGKAGVAPGEVMVATLAGISASGEARVRLAIDGAWHEVAARSAVALGAGDTGCEIAVMFEAGDPLRPFIIGRMRRPDPALEVTADGESVEITAQSEIVLRCGKASLTLTRSGKIVLRGTYILSRSSGPNRVKGGSVQLN